MTPFNAGYRRTREEGLSRLVVNIPTEELESIDAWGAPAGYPNRTAAVRHLLKRGLELEASTPTVQEGT